MFGPHLELCQRDEAMEIQQIDDTLPTPVTFSTRNSRLENPGPAGPQDLEHLLGVSWRPPPVKLGHEPTLGSKTEAPEIPETQMGVDGTAPYDHLRAPP